MSDIYSAWDCAFWCLIKGAMVHILSNSITIIYYVSKQGAAHSSELCQEIKFWDFCVKEDIIPTVTHLPTLKTGWLIVSAGLSLTTASDL